MLLLLNQNKLWNLDADAIIDLGAALRLFTYGIVLKDSVISSHNASGSSQEPQSWIQQKLGHGVKSLD
ncbi:hypothetical protein Tco_1159842 [Tanacetum coccineum]